MVEEIQPETAETNKGKSQDTPDAAIESRGGVGSAGHGATGPGATMQHLKGPKISGAPTSGSTSPGIGYLYVLVAMFLIIGAGTLLSGGMAPVDPNGPSGPPTLEPYFNVDDWGEQKQIFPSNANRPADKNLQLKTFKVNTCGQKTAIMFLIDTSGSMKQDGKIQKEKTALKAIVKKLTAKSVVGMITFSHSVREEIPLSFYKDVKEKVNAEIDGLEPNLETRTRDGFNLASQSLFEAIKGNKYPGYGYNLILLTDGVPEIPPGQPRTCIFQAYDPVYQANRCFAKEQDPRIPTNLPNDLKAMGVKIYTVGIYSQSTTDKQFYPYLSGLLKEISSSPTSYFESIEGGALDKILSQVLNKICEEQGEISTPDTIR